MGLGAEKFYKNYLLGRVENAGHTSGIEWDKETIGTIQRYHFFFELDPFGKLNRYTFIGPFDILASAGGLFTSLKLVVVGILSAATFKYYLRNISKQIKYNFISYERTKQEKIIKQMVERLSSVELFKLFDTVQNLETEVDQDLAQVKEKNLKILQLGLEVAQLRRQIKDKGKEQKLEIKQLKKDMKTIAYHI